MSMSQSMGVGVNGVQVFTTHHRGVTPEELAARATERILYISETAPPVIREQAQAFKDQIHSVLLTYFHEAVRGYKSTLEVRLTQMGQADLIPLLFDM